MRTSRKVAAFVLAIGVVCILRERYVCHRGQSLITDLRSRGCWVIDVRNGRGALSRILLGDDEYRVVEQIHVTREFAIRPEHVTAFPNVTIFEAFENVSVSAEALRALLGHPRLNELNLQDANFSFPDETFAAIFRDVDFRATELRTLYLSGSRIHDRELLRLADDSNLEGLDISDSSVTSAGIASLRRCQRLKFLAVARVPVDRALVGQLSSLRSLQILNLDHTNVGDDDVRLLCRSLVNLRAISLEGTEVTRESLPTMIEAETLDEVNISETSVVASDLSSIAGVRRKHLRIILTDRDVDIGRD